MFVGEYERSIDANGRVALPSTFRDELEGECYLRRDPRGSLTIHPPARYLKEAEDLATKVLAGEADPEALDVLGAATTKVAIDKHGRVTLDERSLQHAGIRPGTNVLFAGTVFGFAVWRPSRYGTVQAERDTAAPGRVWEDDDE